MKLLVFLFAKHFPNGRQHHMWNGAWPDLLFYILIKLFIQWAGENDLDTTQQMDI